MAAPAIFSAAPATFSAAPATFSAAPAIRSAARRLATTAGTAAAPRPAAITEDVFARLMAREGLWRHQSVMVQLGMTARDVVFAMHCAQYFEPAGDGPAARARLHFCLTSFKDPRHPAECAAERQRFLAALASIGIRPVVVEVDVDRARPSRGAANSYMLKILRERLVREANTLGVGTILRCSPQEDRLLKVLASLAKPNIDLAVVPTQTVITQTNWQHRHQVVAVNISAFSHRDYAQAQERLGLSGLRDARHNVFPPAAGRAAGYRALRQVLQQNYGLGLKLHRLAAHVGIHATVLQQQAWLALAECASVDQHNHVVSLVDSPTAKWRESAVVAACMVRVIADWIDGPHKPSHSALEATQMYKAIRQGAEFRSRSLQLAISSSTEAGQTLLTVSGTREPMEKALVPGHMTRGPKGIYIRVGLRDTPENVFLTTLGQFGEDNLPADVLGQLQRTVHRSAALGLPVIYKFEDSRRVFLDMPTLHPHKNVLPFVKGVNYPPTLHDYLARIWGIRPLQYRGGGEYVSPCADQLARLEGVQLPKSVRRSIAQRLQAGAGGVA